MFIERDEIKSVNLGIYRRYRLINNNNNNVD